MEDWVWPRFVSEVDILEFDGRSVFAWLILVTRILNECIFKRIPLINNLEIDTCSSFSCLKLVEEIEVASGLYSREHDSQDSGVQILNVDDAVLD